MTDKLSGADELRRVVDLLNHTCEDTLDGYTAEELLKIARACWASKWDCYPDNLDYRQRDEAIWHSHAPDWSDEDFQCPIYRGQS